MNWVNIALFGIAGGIAGTVAYLIVKRPNEKRGAYTMVMLITWALLSFLLNEFILPPIANIQNLQKAESALAKYPVYEAIKEYAPTTYNELLKEITKGLSNGLTETQIAIQAGHYVSLVLQRFIPSASDEAIRSFLEIMVRSIEELGTQDPDLCYSYLFHQDDSKTDVMSHLSEGTKKANMQAIAEIIRTSAEKPQHIPQESEVLADLENIYGRLYEVHGEDVLLLDSIPSDYTDRQKICSMVAELYRMILQLSPKQSSKVARFMFSEV